MEKYRVNDEELVIIGDLSKMYNVSKRTLRLYHEIELLIPHYVDRNTGYRYYTRAQFPRLNMILQMKSVGLSLKHIKKMLNTRNLSMFEAILGEQMDKLNKRISEYKIYRDSLMKQLDSCKLIQHPPVLNSIFIEYIPRRTAFVYDIDNYDLQKEYHESSPWKTALERVKSTLIEKKMSLSLFHQVGGIVSRESLLQNQFIMSGAFIQLNEDHHFELPLSYIESGTYVCMFQRYTARDNAAESEGIRMLLKHISDNEYQITGPYLCQVIAEASVFDYNDSNILVKQQIPIKVVI